MIYKINITTDEGEVCDILKVDTEELNWDSGPTKRILGDDIIKVIKLDRAYRT